MTTPRKPRDAISNATTACCGSTRGKPQAVWFVTEGRPQAGGGIGQKNYNPPLSTGFQAGFDQGSGGAVETCEEGTDLRTSGDIKDPIAPGVLDVPWGTYVLLNLRTQGCSPSAAFLAPGSRT